MFLVLRFLREQISLFLTHLLLNFPRTHKNHWQFYHCDHKTYYRYTFNNLYKINLLNIIIIITNEIIIFFNMKFQTLNTLFYCMRMRMIELYDWYCQARV